jgi:hypothetical protein
LQKRQIRKLIFTFAYNDPVLCETVSRLDRVDVLGLLNAPAIEVHHVPDIVRGEVLVDSRGTGSFQRFNR